MPTKFNDSCSRCGKPVHRTAKSRPEIVCQGCTRESRLAACAMCAKPLTTKYQRRFCSSACGSAWAGLARRSGGMPKRKMPSRQRAESIAHVIRRDGHACGICGKRVDISLRGNTALGPTLDHVIPVSEGGSDDLANLRLAHLRCNAARCNRGGNEQLALVG